jgi:hypothetical protein
VGTEDLELVVPNSNLLKSAEISLSEFQIGDSYGDLVFSMHPI